MKTLINESIKRREDENYDDYFVRLFENKDLYKLSYIQITELLNHENGQEFSECTYRKRFAEFNRGRIYERNRGESGIATRILSISDTHVPYQLPIETFRDYVGCTDILVLNGDLEDCQSVSNFSKKYRIDITKEMIMTRQYIIDLIEMLSPKRVVIIKGNHEHRMGRYLSDKLNEDIMSIMPDTPMDLIVNDGFKDRDRMQKTETWYPPLSDVYKDSGIDVEYTGDWYRKIGKTIFAHPLTYSSGMLKTTEKAVNYFLRKDRGFDTVCLAHTHKLGSFIQGNIRMYEQGCCCDLSKLDYNDGYLTLPGQNGFIYVCQDVNGSIIPDKTRLIEI